MVKHKSPQTKKYLEKQTAIKAVAQEFANGIPIKEVMTKYNVSYTSTKVN